MVLPAQTEIRRAVADAVALVNKRPGRTMVRLRFAEDALEVDFVANSAKLEGERFTFMSGVEAYEGNLREIAEASAQAIGPA